MNMLEQRAQSELLGDPFDAFEVAPCFPVSLKYPGNANDGELMRADHQDELTEFADHLVWTVYGHRPNQGVWAIGDFMDRETALNMAHALSSTPAGVPVNDETP